MGSIYIKTAFTTMKVNNCMVFVTTVLDHNINNNIYQNCSFMHFTFFTFNIMEVLLDRLEFKKPLSRKQIIRNCNKSVFLNFNLTVNPLLLFIY